MAGDYVLAALMRLFPAHTLAELRRVNETNLDALADRYRPTEERSAGGVTKKVWPDDPDTEGIRCRLSFAGTPQERLTADAVKPGRDYVLVFATGADVAVNDRYLVSGRTKGIPWAVTVEVTGVKAPRSFRTQLKATATAVS